MANLQQYKMPIIAGINDLPSSEGDATHPNSSLFQKQYNDLIDSLQNNSCQEPTEAHPYYIEYFIDSVEGNDSNDGLTFETAVKTIPQLFNILKSKKIQLVRVSMIGEFINPVFDMSCLYPEFPGNYHILVDDNSPFGVEEAFPQVTFYGYGPDTVFIFNSRTNLITPSLRGIVPFFSEINMVFREFMLDIGALFPRQTIGEIILLGNPVLTCFTQCKFIAEVSSNSSFVGVYRGNARFDDCIFENTVENILYGIATYYNSYLEIKSCEFRKFNSSQNRAILSSLAAVTLLRNIPTFVESSMLYDYEVRLGGRLYSLTDIALRVENTPVFTY